MTVVDVLVELESGTRLEVGMPLDVPSRLLAERIMRALGKVVRTSEAFALFFITVEGDKPIPPLTTLGKLGLRRGQQLRIKREWADGVPASRVHAFLRTESGQMLEIEPPSVVLGRSDPQREEHPDIDLSPHDPRRVVSRRHASITREAVTYSLDDLDSSNGTRLNGRPVHPGRRAPLVHGDEIELGSGLRLTFIIANFEQDGNTVPKHLHL